MINLQNGDCLELLKAVPENTFDLICADMPYGTTQCKWDTVIDLNLLWPELERVAKDNAAIVLFAQTPFDKVLGCSNLPLLKYEWVWEKPNATGFFNAKKMPMKAHENILVFYKKLPVYNAIKTTGHKRKTAGRIAIGSEIYGKTVKKTNYDSTERYPRSVQVFSSDKKKSKLHPTQKPEALLEYIIKTYSNQGGHVLDFCMGSGTAGVAAVKLGRKFTGMELEEKYYHVAHERICAA
jgi:site-specific DNA-methyltransferase (adenine-specific)